MAQVLAASQQEYLDKLKKSREAVDSPDETMDSPKQKQEEEQQQQQQQPAGDASCRDGMSTMASAGGDPSSDLTTANGTNNS